MEAQADPAPESAEPGGRQMVASGVNPWRSGGRGPDVSRLRRRVSAGLWVWRPICLPPPPGRQDACPTIRVWVHLFWQGGLGSTKSHQDLNTIAYSFPS